MDMNAIIQQTNGRIFSVRFRKRTTGEIRDMVCRLGVKKHLKGGELPYNPMTKNLAVVFDMQKGDYRTINLNEVLRLKANGLVIEP